MQVRWRHGFLTVALGAALLLSASLVSLAQANHLRPKFASPIRDALIPAHNQCTAPNRTHNPTITLPSCNPAVNVSPYLTTGTPDNNGLPANMAAHLRLDMTFSPPDMQLQAVINDQYCKPTFTASCINTGESLSDFVGGLNVHLGFRLTDHWNGAGATDTATVVDFPVDWPVSCAPVGPGTPGGQCVATTTINTLFGGGAIIAGKRMSWEVSQLYVQDGGSDGNPATTPNDMWLVRGLFQP
jgi:hypothetical protein